MIHLLIPAGLAVIGASLATDAQDISPIVPKTKLLVKLPRTVDEIYSPQLCDNDVKIVADISAEFCMKCALNSAAAEVIWENSH